MVETTPSAPIPFPARPGIRPAPAEPTPIPLPEPDPAAPPLPEPQSDPGKQDQPQPELPAAATADLAAAKYKLGIEGAACLVDTLANAVERAPQDRVTRGRMLVLLRATASNIRELKSL